MHYICICCCLVEGDSGPKHTAPGQSSTYPLATNTGSVGGLKLSGSEHDDSADMCMQGNVVIYHNL